MNAIKRCVRCQSKGELEFHHGCWLVRCDSCGMEGEPCEFEYDAVELWNEMDLEDEFEE